ncbi:response regulator [Dactylosporangium sucinum]|uniref:response regulator n=1 Tax=Dactylosporangium sucinum TaxID=1424081 RepID=UPI001E29B6CC|nr:response regulator [Dactylosporangium sucinum]
MIGKRTRRPRRTAPADPAAPITVVVVGDRDGEHAGLAADGRIVVTGVVNTAAAAVALLDQHDPDVVILDAALPDGSGLDLARAVRASRRAMGIVILSAHDGDDIILAALDTGASALVVAHGPPGSLASAVRHAAANPHSFAADGLAAAVSRSLER